MRGRVRERKREKGKREGAGEKKGERAGESRCSFNPTTTTTAALHIIPV